ncbi:MMPL family transporter [Saccharopolyspora sp. NPDC002686]|uniref:MMPL family transporter n=1 Tax=Saccharopolyspora sp. NPDC002686 TaxID=3154541 RepID=UPI0033182C58
MRSRLFAGFIFNAQPMIVQLGFALALGIVIDAFVIRMTFIPATMALVKEKAWWIPGWLDRLVPDLDVEGDKLTHKIPLAAPTDNRRRSESELRNQSRVSTVSTDTVDTRAHNVLEMVMPQ